MADGNLTFEEFKKLPSEEERGRRYQEMSDHDKFLARCSQPSGAYGVLCNTCIYRSRATCKAFPKGITREHLDKLDDAPTMECAPGIHYKSKE